MVSIVDAQFWIGVSILNLHVTLVINLFKDHEFKEEKKIPTEEKTFYTRMMFLTHTLMPNSYKEKV